LSVGSGNNADKSASAYELGAMERRLKLTSLMNELVSTAEQEPTIGPDLRGTLRELQLRLQFALTSGSVAESTPLPKVAPALFVERHNKKETPVAFIKRIYGPWLPNKLSTDLIRRLDFSLYTAYYRWKSSGGVIPHDFLLKSKKQINDEELERRGFTSGNLDPEAREALRLLRLAKHRRRGSQS
jgi:hypothetical protein